MADPPRQAGATAPEPGPLRTLLVALAVCASCAALVTASVMVLRPYQLANQLSDRELQIRTLVAGLVGAQGLEQLEVQVVELSSGTYATGVDPVQLMPGREDEQESVPLAPERDLAGIGSRPRYALVYRLERDGALHSVILPVSGQGYLATMRGYLAVAGDGNTIRAITFTDHEETPGLGAEVDDPAWQARWRDKRLRDDSGEVRIRVVRNPPAGPEAVHQVQGISGATKTGDGVSNMVRFWVGPDGFGPLLERVRQGEQP